MVCPLDARAPASSSGGTGAAAGPAARFSAAARPAIDKRTNHAGGGRPGCPLADQVGLGLKRRVSPLWGRERHAGMCGAERSDIVTALGRTEHVIDLHLGAIQGRLHPGADGAPCRIDDSPMVGQDAGNRGMLRRIQRQSPIHLREQYSGIHGIALGGSEPHAIGGDPDGHPEEQQGSQRERGANRRRTAATVAPEARTTVVATRRTRDRIW
jgi:hypothetical protein